MNKQNVVDISPRMLNCAQLRVYTGLGRNSAMKLAEKIGAKHKYGSRVLYDKNKLDEYFDAKQNKEK